MEFPTYHIAFCLRSFIVFAGVLFRIGRWLIFPFVNIAIYVLPVEAFFPRRNGKVKNCMRFRQNDFYRLLASMLFLTKIMDL